MIIAVTIAAALGAWLLVAGPIYQAAIELREEQVDREGWDAADKSVPVPPPISRWWWLFPPAAYVLENRRQRKHRDIVMKLLSAEQVRQGVTFLNKATGWLTVAAGAFLIAFAETWNLTREFDWPWWVFVILVVLLSIGCVANAVLRLRGSDGVVAAAGASEADNVG